SHIIRMLPWSKHRDSVDKLVMGGMAKFTLASNAARDHQLLDMLKWTVKSQPKETAAILSEAIDAAETVDTAKLHKQALAAIEELKKKGPGSKRDMSTIGQVAQGAVSLGCIAAAALGQVEFGIPCVVGGALSSAALNYWTSPD